MARGTSDTAHAMECTREYAPRGRPRGGWEAHLELAERGDEPTIIEPGLSYGMAGPKGMPDAIVRKLNRVVRAALDSPDVQDALRSAAAEPAGSSSEEMLQFMQREASRWSAVIR